MEIAEIVDLDREGTRFRVDGYGGVAWYLHKIETDYNDHGELVETGWLVMIMVGDDREFSFEPCEVSPIDDDDYCSQCGQIGCTADGR